MKFILKSLLALIVLLIPISVSVGFYGSSGGTSYICQGGECGLENGITAIEDVLDNVETERSLSVFVVDIVKYLLTFLGLVGVLMIVYAGFTILTSGGDEEKVKTARKIIIYVLIGMVIIFLAYSIVLWLETVFNGE